MNLLIATTEHGFNLKVRPESFFGQFLLTNHTWETAETKTVYDLVRPGDFCIDAGCYVGYFARLMSKCGARVLAVDANPTNFELTCRNADMNIEVVHAALTDSVGQILFHLPSSYDDGWGSIAAADTDINGTVIVPAQRLDHLLDQWSIKLTCDIPRIRLLKMDIEGAEELALRGLGNRLLDVEYIMVECADRANRIAVTGSCAGSINRLLVSAGFQPHEHKHGQWVPIAAAYSDPAYCFLFRNMGGAQ